MATIGIRKARLLGKVVAAQGAPWMLARLRLKAARELGVIERRTPSRPWSSYELSSVLRSDVPSTQAAYAEWRATHAPPFLVEQTTPPRPMTFIGSQCVTQADGILRGEFPYFGYTRHLGFPPPWKRNPISGQDTANEHWARLDEFGFGDIKLTWEASRFSWAFTLARAYLLSHDERYPEAFWALFENWLDENPPFQGVQWKCGQETALRAMALCFASYAFKGAKGSTEARLSRLVSAMAAHAQRIEAFIEYAISQKNNHGISEALGLWTIGLLFPELRRAEQWRARGRQVLEREVGRQIYADGSYVQHSTNYHRVMLQELAWAIRIAELNAVPFSQQLRDAFRRSTHFLLALTDKATGRAPNYGPNDGAHVLPLSDCPYSDLRPVLNACLYIADKCRAFPPGPWDEERAWLNGVESLTDRKGCGEVHSLRAEVGGYYTIRDSESWGMMRAARYSDRPAHADQLHFDLWWRGENILCDAGTFSYNAEQPFEHGYAATRFHNTAAVDGADQMTKVSRFLWVDWAQAKLAEWVPTGLSRMEAEHTGYAKRGVMHRRAVIHPEPALWIIVDDLTGRGRHRWQLQWLTPDVAIRELGGGEFELPFEVGPVQISMACNSSDAGWQVARAGEQVGGAACDSIDPARGWISRFYARKSPAVSITLSGCSQLPVRIITSIQLGNPSPMRLRPKHSQVSLGARTIQLSDIGNTPIFAGVL